MESVPKPQIESKERRIKLLLGLRDFPKKNQDEKRALLGSEQRVAVFDTISTTTNPASKREVKKGIVLEAVEKRLVSGELLRQHPLIYIGSGTDVEYPLALGGRSILMVDPIFGHEEARQELIEKIRKIVAENSVIEDTAINFKFDFGEGPENVRVEMVAQHYPYSEDKRKEGDYNLPQENGVILLYAPDGVIIKENLLREKLVEGGIIINEYTLTNKDGRSIEMGN